MRSPAAPPLSARILIGIILLAVNLLPAADEAADFTRGTRMGLGLTADNRLVPFTLRDTFETDTRSAYQVITRTDSPLDELGYIPLSDRAGVYYAAPDRALYIEAGSGDAAGIERPLPPLADWVLRIRFRTVAVFPGEVTATVMLHDAAGQTAVALQLNGCRTQPHTLTAGGATSAASSARGYLPTAGPGGPGGDDADRLRLAEPVRIEAVIVRRAGRSQVRLNGGDIFDVPAGDNPVTALRAVFTGQEVLLESIEVLALRGTYESPVITLEPEAVPAVVDLVTGTTDPIGAAISLRLAGAAELSELARVDWSYRPSFNAFPADISAPLNNAACLRYRLELTINDPFRLPAPGDELPSITYVMLKRGK